MERPGRLSSAVARAWLLGTYGFVLRLRHKTDVKLYAYAGTILSGIQLFFLAVLVFAAPPFALLKGAIPDDGNGLNPLLRVSGDGDSPRQMPFYLGAMLGSRCRLHSLWAR